MKWFSRFRKEYKIASETTVVRRKCVRDIFRARKRTTQPPIDLLLYSKETGGCVHCYHTSRVGMGCRFKWFSFQIFVRNPWKNTLLCAVHVIFEMFFWRRISNLLSNLGCLFTFWYLDGANSIKTYLHICNLWTGQFVSYMSEIYFLINAPEQNNKK